jgi:hypothetical protein
VPQGPIWCRFLFPARGRNDRAFVGFSKATDALRTKSGIDVVEFLELAEAIGFDPAKAIGRLKKNRNG